ncbi:hypothetical protein [Nostoc sp. 2RC]|uniref:hypothetical protein n=1 Tax=Nostoc sp. 2RC TaxID=2485484 RepID=UPI0016276261|nr:hypothetical protein [Nostoc sp. 2RC]MBC1237155.1 hypothetical protein [Nostoc sp. 2RC]
MILGFLPHQNYSDFQCKTCSHKSIGAIAQNKSQCLRTCTSKQKAQMMLMFPSGAFRKLAEAGKIFGNS